MKFELEKKYIEMEVNKVGDKWVVGKNPKIRDGRVHKDGSVFKYVTCRLYGQYMNNLSYTDREHRFEIKDREKYIKTGIEDVDHRKIDRCRISFPLPLNAVDFSKYDDKVVVDIPDNFRLTVYVQLPEGVKVKGENNHNALKLYNVRMKDILDGRAIPPEYLLFSEQMITDTQYKCSYVKWMEGNETKQILIDKEKITQNAEEMKERIKRVKIYPNRMYKVSSFKRSEDEQGNPLWNEEGRAIYTKIYENDGKPLKGYDIIKRIRESKELFKEQFNVQNKEPKEKNFEQESLFDKMKKEEDTTVLSPIKQEHKLNQEKKEQLQNTERESDPLNKIKEQLMSNNGFTQEEANKFAHSFAGLLNEISRDNSTVDVFNAASSNSSSSQWTRDQDDRSIEKSDSDMEL